MNPWPNTSYRWAIIRFARRTGVALSEALAMSERDMDTWIVQHEMEVAQAAQDARFAELHEAHSKEQGRG